jgi:hypothetical protein
MVAHVPGRESCIVGCFSVAEDDEFGEGCYSETIDESFGACFEKWGMTD